MRRFTLALAAATLALGVTAASAADLGQRPVYKAQPAPIMAAYNWSGFYVGGHLGYAWGSEEVRRRHHRHHRHDRSGRVPGRRADRLQLADRRVRVRRRSATGPGPTPTARPPFPVALVTSEHNWYGTATARVGYAVDNWLWYVKGGAAWLDADYTIAGVTHGDTRTGWTVGTGLEWALGPNWSAKLEYNYLDFGSERVSAPLARRRGHSGPSRQARPELPLRLGQGSGCRAVLIRTSYRNEKPRALARGFCLRGSAELNFALPPRSRGPRSRTALSHPPENPPRSRPLPPPRAPHRAPALSRSRAS